MGVGPLLSVKGLSKAYGSTVALQDASFDLSPGEILAVLGQNGAGKSTLVKLLAGIVQPTAGVISLEGQAQAVDSARAALRRGIVLIPQELAYVPELTVAENIVLGDWGARGGIVSPKRMRALAAPHAEAVGLTVPLTARLSQLSLAQRQLVEIAKALSRNARVLLLDEPTAALSGGETRNLFAALDALRARSGVAMIYISHRLDEVLAQTDRVIVLRDGRVVDERDTADATRAGLVESMLGHVTAATVAVQRSARTRGSEPTVSLRAVSHQTGGLQDVSFDAWSREIIGLFGVAGGGQEALALTLAGLLPHKHGEILFNGQPHRSLRSPRQARKAGVAYVPPERKTQGLILSQGVRHNLTFPQLGRYSRRGIVDRGAQVELVGEVARRFALRYDNAEQPVAELSGGNQQKVLLASRVYMRTDVLVIQEPTRGVDVAARDEIHHVLRQAAEEGPTLLFATSDVEEAVNLSDRLLVLRDGRLVATLEGESKTQSEALAAAGQPEIEV